MKQRNNCIYRIVSFLDGKSYIGMTRRGSHRRKTEHFHQLELNEHYNLHLQYAYNKYGKDNFYFEILEEDIPDDEVHEREKYWIKTFREDHRLYNITDGGDAGGGSGVPMTWNGVEYPTMTACSEAVGICLPTLGKYLSNGYKCDTDIPPHSRNRKVKWDGVMYDTVMDASKAVGIHYSHLTKLLNQGFDSSDQISYNRRKPVIWNGIEYQSVRRAAEVNNIAVNSMLGYLEHGLKNDDDLRNFRAMRPQLNPLTIIIDGVEYSSMSQARKATGLPNSQLKKISNEQRGIFKTKLVRTVEYECAYCHKRWIGKKSDKAKYCSQECMGKARNTSIEITCEVCGGKRRVKIGQKDAKYCSHECYSIARTQHEEAICENCGVSFRVSASQKKSGRGKFCSRECRIKGSRTKVERVCETCGKSFLAVPSKVKIGSAKYCSYQCMGKAYTGKPRNSRST